MNEDALREMACQELVEVITDYLERKLPDPDHARFEAHLATCPACQEYLEQMKALVRLSGRLTPKSLEPTATTPLSDTSSTGQDKRSV